MFQIIDILLELKDYRRSEIFLLYMNIDFLTIFSNPWSTCWSPFAPHVSLIRVGTIFLTFPPHLILSWNLLPDVDGLHVAFSFFFYFTNELVICKSEAAQ